MPDVIERSCSTVMSAMSGCSVARSGNRSATVSSKDRSPSSIICRITVAVSVLVMLPMGMLSSADAGSAPSLASVPSTTVTSPFSGSEMETYAAVAPLTPPSSSMVWAAASTWSSNPPASLVGGAVVDDAGSPPSSSLQAVSRSAASATPATARPPTDPRVPITIPPRARPTVEGRIGRRTARREAGSVPGRPEHVRHRSADWHPWCGRSGRRTRPARCRIIATVVA